MIIAIVYLSLSFLVWDLAAICNAVMDTLKFHYYNSIFHTKYGPNNAFWNEDLQGSKPYIIPGTKYKVNAWHLFKSAMIILQALSSCFIFLAGTYITVLPYKILIFIGLLIIYGIKWNGFFNLFYNKILLKKKHRIS
jgi:hypothetical protein